MHRSSIGATAKILSACAIVSTSVPAFSATPECTAAQAALLGWWTGDTDASDASSNARHGNLGAGAVAGTTGLVGGAFEFATAGDVVTVSHAAVLEPAAQITIEAWIRPAVLTGPATLVSKWSAAQGYRLDIDSGLRMVIGNGTATAQAVGPLPAVDAWTHVAGTYDGSVVRLYVDGALVDSASLSGPIAPSGEQLRVGADFLGLLDEPAIYDRALSAAEVQGIHAAAALGKCKLVACATPPPAMVGWWTGDDTRDAQGGNQAFPFSDVPFAAGKVEYAFNFDGIDDIALVPHVEALRIDSSFTIDLWVQPASLSGGPVLVSKELDTGNRVGLQVAADGTLGGYFDGGAYNVATAAGTIAVGRYTHVAYVFDDAADTVSLYVDGALAASAAETRTPAGNDADLVFGDSTSGAPLHPFAGQLDEIELFDRALTAQEIRSLHAADSAGKCLGCTDVAPGAEVLLWGDFDGSDASGHNRDATIAGGAWVDPFDGMIAGSFFFDGVDGEVVVPSADLGNLYSLDFWFRADADRGYEQLVGNAYPSANFGSLYLNGTQVEYWQDGIEASSAAGSTPPGVWHHVALTYDGSVSRLYVNGALAQESAPHAAPFDNGLVLGSAFVTTQQHFAGNIDEFELRRTVLSASEVESIFRAGSRGVCPDCSAGVFDFAVGKVSRAENQSPLRMRINRTGDTSQPALVRLTTVDLKAAAPGDYAALLDHEVSFAAGQTTRVVDIPLVNDGLNEGLETFGVIMDGGPGACAGATFPVLIARIVDVDTTIPGATLTTVDRGVGEADGLVTVDVQLSAPRGNHTRVNFELNPADASIAIPAQAGSDYSVFGGAFVDIPEGSTTGSLTLALIDDTTTEDAETLVARIAPGTGYVIDATPALRPSNTLTIADDDALPQVNFVLATHKVLENRSPAGFNLVATLSAPSSKTVTVPLTISGDAVEGPGGDYAVAVKQIVFAPGSVRAGTSIVMNDDGAAEGAEFAIFGFGTIVNAIAGAGASSTIRIVDDD